MGVSSSLVPIIGVRLSIFPVSPTLTGNQGRGSRVVGVASDDSSPSPSIMERGKLELGNYLQVSREAPAYPVVRMCIWNCLMACKEYGVKPVGSFEMSYHDFEKGPWVWVRYSFVSDE